MITYILIEKPVRLQSSYAFMQLLFIYHEVPISPDVGILSILFIVFRLTEELSFIVMFCASIPYLCNMLSKISIHFEIIFRLPPCPNGLGG